MFLSKKIRSRFRRRRANRITYLFDLLRELVSRDIKLQYKRSVLGIIWSFITPLMQLVVYYFVFGIVFAVDIPNYVAFIFSGVLVWTWFQMSLFRGASSITDSRELIRQPGFPSAILPIVAVSTNLVNFLLSLPILLVVVGYQTHWINPTILVLPGLIAIQFLFTLSLVYFVAALNVTFRDTQHILGVLLNIFLYLTPILYETNIVPEKVRSIYTLNPMVHIIDAYREILLHSSLPNPYPLIIISLGSMGLLRITYGIFRQASYRFAEEL